MDAKRRKEEGKAKVKAEADLKEAQNLMKEAIKFYHKEWNLVWDRQGRAADLLTDLPANLSRAGLTTQKLGNMTAAAKRSFAREVMGINSEHELAFVLEPRLPEVVLFDFLAQDSPVHELVFRIESERSKARKRYEGDELAEYAERCIENGERSQEVGQVKDANKLFETAADNIEKARLAYQRVKETDHEMEKRWALACNDPGNFPMLTREKREELRKALKDRDKDDVWTDRHWQVRSGMDQPVKHCLGAVKIGISYSSINNSTKWDHCETGLHPDGDDCMHIIERLKGQLAQALEDQKADIEFKALAICSIDELRDAREALIAAAKQDQDAGERRLVEATTKTEELAEVSIQAWQDLDEDALGQASVTDEVVELHEAAKTGDMRKLKYLLEECDEQHFIAINMRHKEYKAIKREPVWVDGLDHQSRSALFNSAKFNIYRSGEYLLDMGANPTRRDLNKVTPLHLACSSGSAEMVRLLLQRGAELEAKEFDGQTPLHYCARYALGNMDIVRTLVGAKGNLNAADNFGQTPIHQVIKNRRFGDKELYFLNFMLLMGGSADSRDEQGRTPLDMCDDMAARAIIKQAYSIQGDLRVEIWGHSALPPPLDGVRPVPIEEQALIITGGLPLLCVLHKGRKAYVNREACRACGIGLVVTVPYMHTADYAHMCVCCAAKEVNTSHIRTGEFV